MYSTLKNKIQSITNGPDVTKTHIKYLKLTSSIKYNRLQERKQKQVVANDLWIGVKKEYLCFEIEAKLRHSRVVNKQGLRCKIKKM